MDKNNTIQQPLDKQGYQTLGKKVFWLFFLQISPIALILMIVSSILLVLSFNPTLQNALPLNSQKYFLDAIFIIFGVSVIAIFISFAYAWLNYINYTFSLTENSFKIKRGVLNKTENAIPYRQIQNVDIERSFTFQMLKLSRLIILTAGHDDESSKGNIFGSDESEGIIPAMDQKLAEWLQTELLKRADVQKVIQTK